MAIENRLPLPEPTIKLLIENMFEIDEWRPERLGFARLIETEPHSVDEKSFDDYNVKDLKSKLKELKLPVSGNKQKLLKRLHKNIPSPIRHVYLTQDQQFAQLTSGRYELDTNEPEENEKIQKNFLKSVDDDLVRNINEQLQEIRVCCILETDHSLRKHAHSTLDALLHIDYEENIHYENSSPVTTFDGLDGQELLYFLDENGLILWKDNHLNELLFALNCQLAETPQGYIVDILSKSPEPEYSQYPLFVARCWRVLTTLLEKEIMSQDYGGGESKSPHDNNSELDVSVLIKIIHTWIRLSTVDYADISNTLTFDLENEILLKRPPLLSPTSHAAFVSDLVVYEVIKKEGIKKYGKKRIKEILDHLLSGGPTLPGNSIQPTIKQSIQFTRANFCLEGEIRLDKLRKLEEQAVTKFHAGLINYILGAKLDLFSDERYERLLKAASIFHNKDPARFQAVLTVLTNGYEDYNDEHGNLARNVHQAAQENHFIHAPTLINHLLSISSQNQEPFQEIMLQMLHHHLALRLGLHRKRCAHCQLVHIHHHEYLPVQKNELESVVEIEKTFMKFEKDDVYSDTCSEILEYCWLLRYFVSNAPLVTTSPLGGRTKEMKWFVKEKSDASQLVVQYELDGKVGVELLQRAAAFCMHLGEKHISEGDRIYSLARAGSILKFRSDQILNEEENNLEMIELLAQIFDDLKPSKEDALYALLDKWTLLSSVGIKIQAICDMGELETQKDFMKSIGASSSKLRKQIIEVIGLENLEFDPPIGQHKVGAQKIKTKNLRTFLKIRELPNQPHNHDSIINQFIQSIMDKLIELLDTKSLTKNQAFLVVQIISSNLIGAPNSDSSLLNDKKYFNKLIVTLEKLFGLDQPSILKPRKNRDIDYEVILEDEVLRSQRYSLSYIGAHYLEDIESNTWFKELSSKNQQKELDRTDKLKLAISMIHMSGLTEQEHERLV